MKSAYDQITERFGCSYDVAKATVLIRAHVIIEMIDDLRSATETEKQYLIDQLIDQLSETCRDATQRPDGPAG